MGIGFAAAVAGGGDAHQAGVEPVLHIALQYAVFDQRGATGGCAFVIHGQTAAALIEAAIVNHGDARCGHAFADAARKGAGALAVEIAFQAVPDGFVQQDAGPAGAEHHCHFAGRGIDGIEVYQRLRQRDIDGAFPGGVLEQRIIEITPAQPVEAGFAAAVLFRHDLHVQPHQRPHVAHAGSVTAQDFNNIPAAEQAGRHLHNARIAGAGGSIDLLHQRHLGGKIHASQRIGIGIAPGVGGHRRHRHGAAMAITHHLDGVGSARDGGVRQIIGVGKGGHLAGHAAQAKALHRIETGGFQPAIIKGKTFGHAILQIKFAIIAAVQRVSDLRGGAIGIKPGIGVEQLGGIRCGHGQDMGQPWPKGKRSVAAAAAISRTCR